MNPALPHERAKDAAIPLSGTRTWPYGYSCDAVTQRTSTERDE